MLSGTSTIAKPIPETREVLLNHLLVQLRYFDLGISESRIVEVLQSLASDLSNNEIIELLKDESILKKRIAHILCRRQNLKDLQITDDTRCSDVLCDKEEIGEQLFQKVAQLDSQLCAQITGMLLEMDTAILKRMMADDKDLMEAVNRARCEYLQYIQGDKCLNLPSCPPEETTESSDSSPIEERELLGEQLYGIVAEKCPLHAGKITGMLLELESDALQTLLKSPERLQEKIEVAIEALSEEADITT